MTQPTKLIQTSFFSDLEEDIKPLDDWSSRKYPSRYTDPDTGAVLKSSKFIKNGKETSGLHEFFINNEWVKVWNVPEKRELRKKRVSSLQGFFVHFKKSMKEKEKNRGKFLIGDNEFDDKWGCHNKIRAHLNKQVERYGYNCPITNREFTTTRNNSKHSHGMRRVQKMSATNISADRILNHIHYTKQNVLFTSWGWNHSRGDLSLNEMKILLNKECVERYEEILMERFPDYKENE